MKKIGCETTSQALLQLLACRNIRLLGRIRLSCVKSLIIAQARIAVGPPDEKNLGVKRPLKPSLCGHNYM